jgi:hypothetical protein
MDLIKNSFKKLIMMIQKPPVETQPLLGSHENPRPTLSYNTDVRPSPVSPLRQLQEICDKIYTSSSLKPYSKVIFLVSRLLVIDRAVLATHSTKEYISSYEPVSKYLNLHDDYSLSRLLEALAETDPLLLKELVNTAVTFQADGVELGQVFHALLQGKFSAGEGLGSFLTPTEIIGPSLDLLNAVSSIDIYELASNGFSDICAGTGRFLYSLLDQCKSKVIRGQILANSVLADHSTLFLDLAKINFYLSYRQLVNCIEVQDSLADARLAQRKYSLLLTNPPFGAGKYVFSNSASEAAKCLQHAGIDIKSPLDPALAFCIQNLLLLSDGGVLGIILPDGILYATSFIEALKQVESIHSSILHPLLIISLPPQAFSLAGTVAKTSLLFLKKNAATRTSASAECEPYAFLDAIHVGFSKKGTRRVIDPRGNDIDTAARSVRSDGTNSPLIRWYREDWRSKETFKTPDAQADSIDRKLILEIASPIRESLKAEACHSSNAHVHISILDVNDIGVISFRNAIENRPTTPGLRCRAGDVIISMLNPKIWRCSLLPDIGCSYSCSPEFLVLRPKDCAISHLLMAVSLLPEVRSQFIEHAKGTSSSRQRVKRSSISLIRYNPDSISEQLIEFCEAAEKLNCNAYNFLLKALAGPLVLSA